MNVATCLWIWTEHQMFNMFSRFHSNMKVDTEESADMMNERKEISLNQCECWTARLVGYAPQRWLVLFSLYLLGWYCSCLPCFQLSSAEMISVRQPTSAFTVTSNLDLQSVMSSTCSLLLTAVAMQSTPVPSACSLVEWRMVSRRISDLTPRQNYFSCFDTTRRKRSSQ